MSERSAKVAANPDAGGLNEAPSGKRKRAKKRKDESSESSSCDARDRRRRGGSGSQANMMLMMHNMMMQNMMLQQRMQQMPWGGGVPAMYAMPSRKKEKKDKKKKDKKRRREESSCEDEPPFGNGLESQAGALQGSGSSAGDLAPFANGSSTDGLANTIPDDDAGLTALDFITMGRELPEIPSAALPDAQSQERRLRRCHGWDNDAEQKSSTPTAAPRVSPAVSPAGGDLSSNVATSVAGKGDAKGKTAGPPEKLHGEAWEEPRKLTGLKLVGELAPPSMQWQYVLFDESRRSYVGYLPCTLGKDVCASFFKQARDDSTWFQPTGASGPIPRKTAWMVAGNCNCAYRYGSIEVQPQRYPPWMVALMEWIMPCCGINSSMEWPNSCNLNLYEDGGMSVGWHADDEQLFQGKFRDCKIISLSFGATRSFEVRLNWCDASKETPSIKLDLADGDLCTMEGMVQKHAQHRIPREDQVSGPRINLTWRWVIKHRPQCPASRSHA
eukprot:TRINITY_DN23204_c0_g2_i1.p1 TRINITY_DN23204_c0_g2~~TRINITY_DN23204_c0_g2_i1.p1  ORF type:complete len:499 (-),score=76.45 TRINITY_DN23204_c0_g2_i1:69-1565(-)